MTKRGMRTLPLLALAACEPAPVVIDTEAQECLALAMYFEARGEGKDGMLAVGAVVMNRVANDQFPNDVCSVVREGGETAPCQFSWWCDGRSDRPKSAVLWDESRETAGELLSGQAPDPTGGALYFHHESIEPPWQKERTVTIGGHVFYR